MEILNIQPIFPADPTWFKKYIYLFIWLPLVLVTAYGIFGSGMQTLSCGMWDLVPWPGIEPRAPCIGSVESSPLDHQGSLSPYLI